MEGIVPAFGPKIGIVGGEAVKGKSAGHSPTTIVIDLAASAIFFDAKYKPYGFCIESILSIQAFPAR
jgi:hypothetical protein